MLARLGMDRFHRGSPFGLLLVLPTMLVLAITIVYPLISVVLYSFQKVKLGSIGSSSWIGFKNYEAAIGQADFVESFVRSGIVTVASVFLTIVIGLAIALLLNQEFRGRGLVRSLVVLPWALPTFVAAFSWRWLLDYNYGFINHSLSFIGVPPILFLSSNPAALMSVIAVYVWKGVPWAVIIFLAGLQSVRKDLREAARVDGASSWSEFWHIVLPSIRFVVEIATILLFVWNFNWFDMMWLLTQGGPGNATTILPIHIFRQAFTALNFGQASAVSVLALTVPVVFTLLVFRVQRQRQGAL